MDGNQDEVRALAIALNDLKKNLPFNMEFLVTNNRIELHDIRHLIDQLYELYKKQKELRKEKTFGFRERKKKKG